MPVLGRDFVFNGSMAEFVESYLIDERLRAWQFERWSESFDGHATEKWDCVREA